MKTIVLDYTYKQTQELSTFMRSMTLKKYLLDNDLEIGVDFDIFHTYNKIHIRFLTENAASWGTYIRLAT